MCCVLLCSPKSNLPSVSLSVSPSVPLFCVRAITLYCMKGFPSNLAEVFGISRRCVKRTTPLSQRTRSHRQFGCKNTFVSGLLFPYAWKDFKVIWHKCLAYQDNMLRKRNTPISQRSRAHMQFKCTNATIRVRAVVSLCIEGSYDTSV